VTSGKTIASLGWKGLALAAGMVAFLGFALRNPAIAAGTQDYSEFAAYEVNGSGGGDDILRLIDPVGCGNSGVVNLDCLSEQPLCAMIYVFDADQEMGECCGCPITPNELQTYSVEDNLLSNWALGSGVPGVGVIVVRDALPQNNNGTCNATNAFGATNPACNAGCDPTEGYQSASTIFGSITQGNQRNLIEIPLFNNGEGDAVNNAYLYDTCGSLVGNGSGVGYCHCPTEPTP
jgi:hypothetical protein